MVREGTLTPLIVSTWSFGLRGNVVAWPSLFAGGTSLDAVERVCAIVDADPEVDSVGYGGLPDASGGMSLDGCVMLAPDRCGSVCAIRRHLHPVTVARHVMERTGHVMLAGSGADDFADGQGLAGADLLAPKARASWEAWRHDPRVVDQSRDGAYLPPRPMDTPEGTGRLFHDTIGVLAVDGAGVLAGACSTSGMPYKVPGRVGDSPIIGAGLYVHPEHGACVATGAGELMMGLCATFLAVECMRRGSSPLDALREVLDRLRAEHPSLRPEHQCGLIALRPDGTTAAAALRPGFRVSLTHIGGSNIVDPDVVLLPD